MQFLRWLSKELQNHRPKVLRLSQSLRNFREPKEKGRVPQFALKYPCNPPPPPRATVLFFRLPGGRGVP